MKQILCPVDFSEFSRHAFDRAVGVARSYDSTITVLHVFPRAPAVAAVPSGPEGPGPAALHRASDDDVVEHMQRFLAVDPAMGVTVDYCVTEAQAVHRGILEQAKRLTAELIVLGTHGRSGFDRLFLGSVTEKVLRSAPVPVLTVPSGVTDLAPAGRAPFTQIVCAVDFSDASVAAFELAAALATDAAARVTLLHVVELLPVADEPMVTPPFDSAQYRAAVEKASLDQLGALVPAAMRGSCEMKVVSAARAYEGILRVAAAQHADLVVLGVHGRNMLDRMLFGSTAGRVVRRATCPVLTVRRDSPE